MGPRRELTIGGDGDLVIVSSVGTVVPWAVASCFQRTAAETLGQNAAEDTRQLLVY